MGERKGVNKYYPPDYDPRRGGLNKFQGTHALRERARKLHLGILIIRFEMPYNIWCEGCENHIGTGVRYNAEKKKVGMYYSTPIYQFRMKCHLCDNHFEIKTDPANLDYEIVTGARRQERRWDPADNEQVAPEDKEVTRKMALDAMFKLEHGVIDKGKSKEVQKSLEQLEEFQSRRWHDDYAANKSLRESMRVRRTKEQDQATQDASYHLPVPLLPPNEKDARAAKLLQLTQSKTSHQLQKEKRISVESQSVFVKANAKSIALSNKKAYARQFIDGIVTNSHKSFSNFKNLKPQNLGVVLKRVDPEVENFNDTESPVDNITGNGPSNLNVKNTKPEITVNSSMIGSSVSCLCGNCNLDCNCKESSISKISKLKEVDFTPSTSGFYSENSDVSVSLESSITDDKSPIVGVNSIQSLVGYSDSD